MAIINKDLTKLDINEKFYYFVSYDFNIDIALANIGIRIDLSDVNNIGKEVKGLFGFEGVICTCYALKKLISEISNEMHDFDPLDTDETTFEIYELISITDESDLTTEYFSKQMEELAKYTNVLTVKEIKKLI